MTIKHILIFFIFFSNIILIYPQQYLFESDIFANIAKYPDYYKNNGEYNYDEIIPDSNYLLNRLGVELEIIVSNSEIEIYYFKINNIFHIQLVKLKKNTSENILGKYIGISIDELLLIFGIPDIINKHEIIYFSKDFLYYVNFKILNNLIESISFGYSS
jgi:hypothetical protein